MRKTEESRMTLRFLAAATTWMEVTFPEREEPGKSRIVKKIRSILDTLNLRCQ